MKTILAAILLLSNVVFAQGDSSYLQKQMFLLRTELNNKIFVQRFESVETPCLYIDTTDDRLASAGRQIINSNYKVRLKEDDVIDSGVRCLSQHYSRYMQFRITDSVKMKGTVSSTYSYPAGSLIQYLGRSINLQSFYDRLLSSNGRFEIYTEEDKFRIKVVMEDGPYDNRDAVYGYIEIVQGVLGNNGPAYQIFFDQMSLHRGNTNNQILLKFTSTNLRFEFEYFTRLAYEVLKNIYSSDNHLRAQALWLHSFLTHPACVSCHQVYSAAMTSVNARTFKLPNTEPLPAK